MTKIRALTPILYGNPARRHEIGDTFEVEAEDAKSLIERGHAQSARAAYTDPEEEEAAAKAEAEAEEATDKRRKR
ncbi:MAG: hypothetical protein ACSLE2_10870 [Lysobacterales bacterium]